jgi:hypothetical protein
MSPMLRRTLAFAGSLSFVLALACSGSDTTPIDASAPTDAAKEAAPPITCAGAVYPSNITCRAGAEGKACDIVSVKLVCPDGGSGWVCSPGSVPADKCGCNTQGTNLKPGDPCGGTQDASTD